jgi:hypothetical protein
MNLMTTSNQTTNRRYNHPKRDACLRYGDNLDIATHSSRIQVASFVHHIYSIHAVRMFSAHELDVQRQRAPKYLRLFGTCWNIARHNVTRSCSIRTLSRYSSSAPTVEAVRGRQLITHAGVERDERRRSRSVCSLVSTASSTLVFTVIVFAPRTRAICRMDRRPR